MQRLGMLLVGSPCRATCWFPEIIPSRLKRRYRFEPPGNLEHLMARIAPERVVEVWDAQYHKRVLKYGVVLVCRPIWLEL